MCFLELYALKLKLNFTKKIKLVFFHKETK